MKPKGSITSILFSSNERPFGLKWEEWTILWWKWFLAIPKENNPALDNTGEKSTINQSYANVWFLASTIGGKVERIVKIPSGTAVLFPVINVTASKSENPALKTESELRSFVKANMDDIEKKQAFIDDQEIVISEDFRVKTPPFEFSYPVDNIFGAQTGPAKGVGDGYWIFLKPLSKGEHHIRTSGSCLSGKIQIDANIRLIVEN